MQREQFFILFYLFVYGLASQSWSCGDSILDARDGQIYNTVQIGTQCWMAQNLNYGLQAISHDSSYLHSDVFNDFIAEKYCLSNDPLNCGLFGGLYDWDEMMDYSTLPSPQGLCPTGWYVPSDNDWQELLNSLGVGKTDSLGWLGTDQGDQIKAIGNSGFNSLYGIGRNYDGKMGTTPMHAYYWTSTNNSPYHAWYYHVSDAEQEIYRNYSYKSYGYSVRCIKDTVVVTGQNTKLDELKFKVYPNPASDYIIIETPIGFGVPCSINFMNVNGQIINRDISISKNNSIIKTDGIPFGIYFVKIISDLNIKIIKVQINPG
jgi:uncharacterized protein (TIGR02145 family)